MGKTRIPDGQEEETLEFVIEPFTQGVLFVSTYGGNAKKPEFIPYCTGEEFKDWLKTAIKAYLKGLNLSSNVSHHIRITLCAGGDLYPINKTLLVKPHPGVKCSLEQEMFSNHKDEYANHSSGLKCDTTWLKSNAMFIEKAMREAIEEVFHDKQNDWGTHISLSELYQDEYTKKLEQKNNAQEKKSTFTIDFIPFQELVNKYKQAYRAQLIKLLGFFEQGRTIIKNLDLQKFIKPLADDDSYQDKLKKFDEYHLDLKAFNKLSLGDLEFIFSYFRIKEESKSISDEIDSVGSIDGTQARDVFLYTTLAALHHFIKPRGNGDHAKGDTFQGENSKYAREVFLSQDLFAMTEMAMFHVLSQAGIHVLYPKALKKDISQQYMSLSIEAGFGSGIKFTTRQESKATVAEISAAEALAADLMGSLVFMFEVNRISIAAKQLEANACFRDLFIRTISKNSDLIKSLTAGAKFGTKQQKLIVQEALDKATELHADGAGAILLNQLSKMLRDDLASEIYEVLQKLPQNDLTLMRSLNPNEYNANENVVIANQLAKLLGVELDFMHYYNKSIIEYEISKLNRGDCQIILKHLEQAINSPLDGLNQYFIYEYFNNKISRTSFHNFRARTMPYIDAIKNRLKQSDKFLEEIGKDHVSVENQDKEVLQIFSSSLESLVESYFQNRLVSGVLHPNLSYYTPTDNVRFKKSICDIILNGLSHAMRDKKPDSMEKLASIFDAYFSLIKIYDFRNIGFYHQKILEILREIIEHDLDNKKWINNRFLRVWGAYHYHNALDKILRNNKAREIIFPLIFEKIFYSAFKNRTVQEAVHFIIYSLSAGLMHANIRLNGHGTWVEAALTHWQAKINLKKFNKVDLKEVHHMANAFVLSRDKLMTFSADVEFSSSKEFFEESYCWETCKFMTQTIDGKRLLARLMDRLLLGDYLTDSFEEHQFKSVLCIVMGGLIILGHQFNSSIFVYRYLRTAFLYKECWPILLKILSLNWAPCLDNSGLLMLLGESCLPSSLRENLLSQMEAQEVSALSNYKTNFLDYGFDPFGLYEDVSPEHPKRNNAPSSVSDDEQYKYISVLANWVKNQVQHLNDSEVKHLNINELKSLKPIVLSKKYYEYLINDSIKYSLLFIKNVEHSPHAAHLFVQSLTTMLIKFNLIPATYESASLFLSEKLGLKIKIKEGEEQVLVPSSSSATILRNLPWKRNRTRQNNAQESGVHDIKNSLVC